MNKEFKKATYKSVIVIFLLGVMGLVAVSVASYFSFDEVVVMMGEMIALIAFLGLLIMCVSAKSTYNQVCTRFAEYIVNNRKKDSGKRTNDAERIKEIQNMKAAAAQEKERAVAAALEQGRSEGAKAALEGQYSPAQTYQAVSPAEQPPAAQPQAAQPQAVQPQAAQPQAVQPQAVPIYSQPPVMQPSTEEMLYNEYGEPVMVRRRVRRAQVPAEGEILYDSMGNPVVRRNQGLWETLEPRREIIVKLETAPNTTAFVTNIDKPAASDSTPGNPAPGNSAFSNYTYGHPASGNPTVGNEQ